MLHSIDLTRKPYGLCFANDDRTLIRRESESGEQIEIFEQDSELSWKSVKSIKHKNISSPVSAVFDKVSKHIIVSDTIEIILFISCAWMVHGFHPLVVKKEPPIRLSVWYLPQ